MASIRILSIDGGGIRGIIPAVILSTLEDLLKKYSHRPNAKLVDYFDLIAGTSTGGILTALYLCPNPKILNTPLYSAQDAVDLYLNYGKIIFQQSFIRKLSSGFGVFKSKYVTKGFFNLLKDFFGDIYLSQLLKPCLITAYDIEHSKSTFFNQLDPYKVNHKDFFIRDIILATTAAPTYFPIAHITATDKSPYLFVDGGVFANNPSLCAYVESRQLTGPTPTSHPIILSLGTGTSHKTYDYKSLKQAGQLKWALPSIQILMNSGNDIVDTQLNSIYTHANLLHYYLRIQADLSNERSSILHLDNTDPNNLVALQNIGKRLSNEYYHKLEKFAQLLIANSSSSFLPA